VAPFGADLGIEDMTRSSPITGDSSMLAKKLPQKPSLLLRPKNPTSRLPNKKANTSCISLSPIPKFGVACSSYHPPRVSFSGMIPDFPRNIRTRLEQRLVQVLQKVHES
jgi:hypothetical protein